jgi:hypothetical protein
MGDGRFRRVAAGAATALLLTAAPHASSRQGRQEGESMVMRKDGKSSCRRQ